MPRLVSFNGQIDTNIFCTDQASGGIGGSRHIYVKLDKGAVMTKFEAWKQDWRIRGVEMTMSDGTQQLFGSRQGDSSSFTISSGETLTKLMIQVSGQTSNEGHHRVGAISMETSKGRSWGIYAPFGNLSKDGEYWYDMPNSGIVCGMFGQCGADVDCLGFAVMNPIERTRLVDVTYPKLDAQVVATTPTTVATEDYRNGTSLAQSYTLSGTKTVTKERSWSESTHFELSTSVTVSAGIPEVVEVGNTLSWSVSGTSEFSRKTNVTEEQKWTWRIECPPHRQIRATGTMYQDSIDTPYTAKVQIHLKNGHVYEYQVDGIYDGLNVRNGVLKIEDLGPYQ